jgi:hypothetical protein
MLWILIYYHILVLNIKLLKHLLKHDPQTKYSSNIIQINQILNKISNTLSIDMLHMNSNLNRKFLI